MDFAINPGEVVPWADTPAGRDWVDRYAGIERRPFPAFCTRYDAHDSDYGQPVYSLPFRLMWQNGLCTVHECAIRNGESMWHIGTFFGRTPEDTIHIFRYIEQNGIYVPEDHSFPQIIREEDWLEWLS